MKNPTIEGNIADVAIKMERTNKNVFPGLNTRQGKTFIWKRAAKVKEDWLENVIFMAFLLKTTQCWIQQRDMCMYFYQETKHSSSVRLCVCVSVSSEEKNTFGRFEGL